MDKINIENAEKVVCPTCESVLGMKNGEKFLYKNIAWIFFTDDKTETTMKCRKCKNVLKIK